GRVGVWLFSRRPGWSGHERKGYPRRQGAVNTATKKAIMTAGPDAAVTPAASGAAAPPKRRVPISLFRRSKRRGLTEIPGRADIWALSAVLLGYPDEEFYNMVPEL